MKHEILTWEDKPEGRKFDSPWCHWNFSLTKLFRPHYDTGVDSASNRYKYQGYLLMRKGGLYEWLTTLPPSCAYCLEILGASTSWSSKSDDVVVGYLHIQSTDRHSVAV